MNIRKERRLKLDKINRKWYYNKMRVFGLVIFLCYLVTFKGCVDYTWQNRIEVTVIDKMESAGKSSSNYYLILKDNKGRVFDEIVSPADYSQSEKGKSYYMNIKEMNIKQTPMKNLFFFLLPCIFFCIFIVIIPASFIKF
jgi:hypothetical protein